MIRRRARRGSLVLVALLLVGLLAGAFPVGQASAATEQWCPPQAAPYCAENAFLDYWRGVDRASDGHALDIIGFPISPALQRPSDGLVVQFYERAVFEWHPEIADSRNRVLLSRLGAAAIDADTSLGLKEQRARPPESCQSAADCSLAPTNHTLRGAFLLYWLANGGLPVFGYPLTEQFQLPTGTGQPRAVQYFERGRFEAHPENADPRYQVLLSRLGAEEYQRAGARNWLVVATPQSTAGTTQPPTAPVTVTITPTAGPPGTQFIIRALGFPAGAKVDVALSCDCAATMSLKSFQLAPNETGLALAVNTAPTAPPGTRTLTFRVNDQVLGRGSYTVTAPTAGPTVPPTPTAAPAVPTTPAPAPSPSAPPASPRPSDDQTLIATAADLIARVPEFGYIVTTINTRPIPWAFAALPQDVYGQFNLQTGMITYSVALRAMDPHDLASVMGHEGQHVYDVLTYGVPQTSTDCYKLEYRGFLTGAALWKAWYGPNGKPVPVNTLELFQNQLLAILQADPAKFEAWLARAYANECGTMATGGQSARAGVLPPASEGLPDLVRASFPGVDRWLASFDPTTVGAFEVDPTLPLVPIE